MSLPNHSPLTTPRPTTLAEAVAQSRYPRNRATVKLAPHRDELLRLRQAGESVETLAAGLRLMEIEIGRETLRRWLDRELGRVPARRKRRAAKPTTDQPAMVASANSAPASATTISMPPA